MNIVLKKFRCEMQYISKDYLLINILKDLDFQNIPKLNNKK